MLLEVEGLEAGYGKLTVLHGIDLNLGAGEVVVVLGPNGAGKSTLTKTIASHLPAIAGEIRLDGERIEGLSPYEVATRGVAYVPQEQNIFDGLSVIDNLRVSALSLGREGAVRVEAALTRFPVLRDRSSQKAATLSGGEHQVLAISSALITGSSLLVLDEPTAGLAPIFLEEIVSWIEEIAGSGTGVLWVVEQNPEPILAISGRTYVMEGGLITSELDSKDLLRPGRLEEVLLEERRQAPA